MSFTPPVDQIEAELTHVLDSRSFGRSARQRALLRYLVDGRVAVGSARLKESTIALEVFKRDAATYDSATDGIVRVSVNRLRDLLDRYYEDEGARAALRFEIQSGGYVPIIRRATPPGLPPLPRIAVLPAANFTGNPDFDPLCDGLTEDIIDAMTRVPDARVIARTSSFRFKGQTLDVREIARALNVDALLEGSVQQVGDRLRVTAQRVLGSDGSHTVASHKPPSTLSSTCACLSRAAGRIRVRFSNTRWRSRTVSCRSSCSCLRIRYSIVITPIRAGCNC